jgi:hypothetical protein
LTELDLSNVPSLTSLICTDNRLTDIDIRRCETSDLYIKHDASVTVHKRDDQILRSRR